MRIHPHHAVLVFLLALQHVSYPSFASELAVAPDGRAQIPMHERYEQKAVVLLLHVACARLVGAGEGEEILFYCTETHHIRVCTLVTVSWFRKL